MDILLYSCIILITICYLVRTCVLYQKYIEWTENIMIERKIKKLKIKLMRLLYIAERYNDKIENSGKPSLKTFKEIHEEMKS